jgi:ADP-dependent NAD(P)H-hydrate dehydratase
MKGIPTMADIPPIYPRSRTAHKGDFGHLLLIGGSQGMSGAIALAGMAANRAGAGRVTIATSMAVHSVVATLDPCYMVIPCPSDSEGKLDSSVLPIAEEWYSRADCIALGPGLGQSQALAGVVEAIYCDCPKPVVVDADALSLLAQRRASHHVPAGVRILTPHPGEFRRLAGDPSLSSEQCRSLAAELSTRFAAIIVCKGHQTVLVEGNRRFENSTGNPGMATAGAGDVLTGVIAALIGQKYSAWDAAVLGVYLHGLAGDLAAAQFGEISVTATDIISHLPQAIVHVQNSPPTDRRLEA